jgi:hypothetical protein
MRSAGAFGGATAETDAAAALVAADATGLLLLLLLAPLILLPSAGCSFRAMYFRRSLSNSGSLT